MPTANQKTLRDRLSWVESARQGILSAIGDDVVDTRFTVHPTVDPLKLILKVTLRRPLAKNTKGHLRTYLRCHAESNGCELPTIKIKDSWIQAEVLIQSRHWSRDAKGKFLRGGRRFTGRTG